MIVDCNGRWAVTSTATSSFVPYYEPLSLNDEILQRIHEDTKLEQKMRKRLTVERVIFSPPATIVLWKDGTKTVVKCSEDDEFSREMGLALCYMKKALGNKGNYNNVFRRWINGSDN